MLSSLQKDLIRDEDLRYDAYRDSVGLWTIGVGHLLGPTMRMERLTEDEVYAFLEYDIKLAENRCRELFPNWVLIDTVRQDALVNMSFNLGNRLRGFGKFIAAVNGAVNTIANDEFWRTAGREMIDSLWAKQVGQRAVRLRSMVETGRRL